jgi:hypothetical protein
MDSASVDALLELLVAWTSGGFGPVEMMSGEFDEAALRTARLSVSLNSPALWNERPFCCCQANEHPQKRPMSLIESCTSLDVHFRRT